ncbi:hypothetical protein BDZ88DRAFT_452452 [Geranomyces variabilis]|nr:hypothetical protein BDZ88DRAFT_452452 [Geranomyces variabilis]
MSNPAATSNLNETLAAPTTATSSPATSVDTLTSDQIPGNSSGAESGTQTVSTTVVDSVDEHNLDLKYVGVANCAESLPYHVYKVFTSGFTATKSAGTPDGTPSPGNTSIDLASACQPLNHHDLAVGGPITASARNIAVYFTSTQELLKFTSVCRSFMSAPLPQHYAQVLRRQFYHDRRPMLHRPALPLCVRDDPAVDGPSPVATKFFYNTVRKLMAMDTCWNSESTAWKTEEPVLLEILRFGLVPLAQDLIDSGMRFRHEGSDGIKCAVMSNNFLAVKFAVEQKLDTRFARRNMPPAPLVGALEGALDRAIKVENNQIIDYLLQMVRENTMKPYILRVTEDTLIKLIDDKSPRCWKSSLLLAAR